jgi:acetoin utilization deacetylase AcuC-like enzyme
VVCKPNKINNLHHGVHLARSFKQKHSQVPFMNKTGILKDKRYMDHDMGPYHPESPQRLEVIYDMLEEPDMEGLFTEIQPRRAKKEEIEFIHSKEYIDLIASTDGEESVYLDGDTRTSPGSYKAALLAAGGFCEAVSMVNSGRLKNAFGLIRPPGHHAERSRAMGFCIFNNIAIGARYAQEHLGLQRILIIDWDLHHGNGTQHSFEDDPSILYFSTHQYPFYPGTGSYYETGTGKGEGFTINVPLSTGYGEGEFIAIFERLLKPVALEFKPDIILVSAGFDIHESDPLGGMRVRSEGFAGMMASLMGISDLCCNGKIAVALEGGYNIKGQRDSVKEVLKELVGIRKTNISDLTKRADQPKVDHALKPVIAIHKRYWKSL